MPRDKETWYWLYKDPRVGIKENCCSDNAISFHNYKDDRLKYFTELDLEYNIEEGVNGKKFEIPEKPRLFLYGKLNFTIDEFRNNIDPGPPSGQRIYKGVGKERVCYKCDYFTHK